jgi:uncharacterized membrane protein YjgN (DUF898 family)
MADMNFDVVDNQTAQETNMASGGDGSAPSTEISFRGNSETLFKIWITNLLLSICTLGIYHPWGKARMRKYIYSSTYVGDYNFEFHGTGKEMFIGMLKFWGIIAAWVLLDFLLGYMPVEENSPLDILLWIVWLPLLIPMFALFVHGGRRYRMSKTSYRGIRFGYRGTKKGLILLMLKGILLTAVTLGIYFPWFLNSVRKYLYSNTRYGNVECDFTGIGSDFAGIVFFHGILLTGVTFGIYQYWYKSKLFKFFYEHISFSKDGKELGFITNATGKEFLKLLIINWVIIVFTLGLGFPIVKIRNMHFIAEHVDLAGDLNLDSIVQSEATYSDATGDTDAGIDFFDFDLF